MGDRFGNFCDGSNSAEIGHHGSMCGGLENFCYGNNSVEIALQIRTLNPKP